MNNKKHIIKTGAGKFLVRQHTDVGYIDHQYIYYQDAKRHYDNLCAYHYDKLDLLKVGKGSKLLESRPSFKAFGEE